MSIQFPIATLMGEGHLHTSGRGTQMLPEVPLEGRSSRNALFPAASEVAPSADYT